MSNTLHSTGRINSRIHDTILYGEKSRESEDNFGKIKIEYKEKRVNEFLIDWLNRHRVRTPTKILDLFDELDDYVNVQRKTKKVHKSKETFQRKLAKDKNYDQFLHDRTRVLSGLLRKHEEMMDEEEFPSEFDILTQSDIIYANQVIIDELGKSKRAITSMSKIKRNHNSFQRIEISNKIKYVMLSVINVMLRVMEIEFKIILKDPMEKSLQLLEWDLNTLILYNSKLTEYSAKLLKIVKKKTWSKEFTEETRELIRLFSDGEFV